MILPAWAATFVGLFIVWTMIVWSFLVGIYGIIAALKSRGYNSSWGWGLVSSAFTVILSVGFAVLVITDPAFAIKALVWVAGFWALIVGLGLVFIAFRVRRGVNLLGDEMADAIRNSAS